MVHGEASQREAWCVRSVVKLVMQMSFSLASATALLLAAVASATADGTSCRNEALRSELGSSVLPECRAYEMVSPPYKAGQPLLVVPAGYTADGEEVVLHSLAGIAGAAGSGEAATESNWYLAARRPGGWRLSGMNAPLSEFVGQIPFAVEADDGLSLWTQHTPQQSAKTAGLYIRSADRKYSIVGTLSPNGVGEKEESDFIEATNPQIDDHPIAATSTYQHIVIQATAPEAHWSFDHTSAEESLYEYSGTNNQYPVLVAVMGSEKGSDELLASCGAALGSGGPGSAYNALARDGETIFFTLAPCSSHPAELYARLHGAVNSPGAAESIDVGESECSGECGEESGKNFEGASENGERVFFTSTQKLTNSASVLTADGNAAEGAGCAGISGGCNLYEYNFALPAHERLKLVAGGGADDMRGVAGIAADGSRVYFVADGEVPDAGENEFHRKPVGGRPNLYTYDSDTGARTFIATLGEAEEETRDWERGFSRPVEVTGEAGRFLLFLSAATGITPDEASKEGVAQLFEYDAQTGELVRVSQGEEGYAENGNGVAVGIEQESIAGVASLVGELDDFKVTTNRLNVANDGKTVVFETKGALAERAAAASALGCTSVYEFSSEGPIADGKVHLLSDGRDTQLYQGVRCGATFKGMDEDGSNVLIFTSDPMLSNDVDGVQPDVYDARVSGGFAPGPVGGESAACLGGHCLGSWQGSTGASVVPSVAEGNLAPMQTSAVGGASKHSRHAVGKRFKHGPSTACRRNTRRRGHRTCRASRGRAPKRMDSRLQRGA